MIKKLLIILLGLHCMVTNAESTRPNIVLFVMDDMGWQDTSVPFWKKKSAKNNILHTPSMERLAESGTKFTNAYVTPNDQATQISLHTAVSTARHHAAYIQKATTLTQLLKKAGYSTISCSGAKAPEGFTTDFDLSYTNATISKLTPQIDSLRADKKPFFLYFHATVTDSTTHYAKYRKAGLRVKDAKYASAIQSMDDSLGEITNYLETNDLIKNTIIILISDCGGRSQNTGRQGAENTQNYPLHAGKGSLHEGGVRVPMIVKQNINPALKECTVSVQAIDIMPTILDMAGGKHIRTRQRIDGKSFAPVIRNSGNRTHSYIRSIYWHSPQETEIKPSMGYGAASSIVNGYWKLIYYYKSGKTELFNLKDDIFEISNQAANKSISHIRERLANDLTRHLKSKRAQIPASTYPNGSKYRR